MAAYRVFVNKEEARNRHIRIENITSISDILQFEDCYKFGPGDKSREDKLLVDTLAKDPRYQEIKIDE